METVLNKLWENVENEEAVLLSTCAENRVTTRAVSPVRYEDAVLIFTEPESLKYQQLKKNPLACFAMNGLFLEAKASFLGPTLADNNAGLREMYAQKFPAAFDEGIPFGGRNAEFILFTPIRLSGWDMTGQGPCPVAIEF